MQIVTQIGKRDVVLDLQPAEFDFQFTRDIHGRRAIVLSWRRVSQYANLVYLRIVTLRLAWPFILNNCAILDRNEPVEEINNEGI